MHVHEWQIKLQNHNFFVFRHKFVTAKLLTISLLEVIGNLKKLSREQFLHLLEPQA